MKKFFILTFLLFFVSFPSYSEARRNKKTPASVVPPVTGPISDSIQQKILTAEDQRLSRDPALLAALQSSSPKIVKAALIALGRIGDPAAIESIMRILSRKDRELKKTAAFALGLIQDPNAIKMLVQNVPMQKDPDVIAALLISVGRAGNEQSVNTVANSLRDASDSRIHEAACHALGVLWSGNSEKWAVPAGLVAQLLKLAIQPEPVGLACAFSLARYRGETPLPAEEVLEAAQKTVSSDSRALLTRALSKIKNPNVAHFLSQQVLNDANVGSRIEAVKGLGAQAITDEVIAAYKKGMADSSSALVVQTLESAATHVSGATALTETIDNLYRTSPSAWVKSTALRTLAKVNPVLGRQRITEVLKVPTSPLLPAAVGALGVLGLPEDVERLAGYVTSSELRVAVEAIEAVSGFPEEKISPTLKAALKQAVERGDTAVTFLAVQIVEKFKWKEFAASIVGVYPLFSAPDQVEAKVALLNALGVVGDRSHVGLIEEAMKESERLVIVAAVEAYRAITGKDESAKIPLNSKVIATPPPLNEALAATRARVVITTNRGEIHLRMLEDTPLNALNFVRLVKQGALKQTFYDGKTFHRVVPNFVVQGGDPRGDGYGGPGYLVRDEVSNRIHTRGAVGMATAGKDTGGCQFFINLAPNLHLDGRYTLFAEVTKGMDVAEKLEVGDRIVTAKLLR